MGEGFLSIYGALDSLFSMGRIGVGISNSLANQGKISRAQGFFASQLAINEETCYFNQAVASRAGNLNIANILRNTEETVSAIKTIAPKRGVEFEGSSQMFVDAATTMGMHAAYEAAYDTEVRLASLDLQRESANRKGAGQMEDFEVMKRQNQSNIMDQVMGIAKLFGTDFSNQILQQKNNQNSRQISRGI
jgi:hypothetical protein